MLRTAVEADREFGLNIRVTIDGQVFLLKRVEAISFADQLIRATGTMSPTAYDGWSVHDLRTES